MFNKIKNYQKRLPLHSLTDLRTIGLLVFLIIVLLVSWSGVKSIQSNYALQKQVATLQQQNIVQQLENNNQQLQNNYYNTNQYLELSARQELGLGQPGETELIVPKNVALSYLTPTNPNALTSYVNNNQPWYERNFEAWMNFFLDRQNANN